MADRSAIEWTDSTFNPWIGCTKVSPACDHCYAEVSTPSRTRGVEWGAGKPRHRTSATNWKLPLRWNARPFWQCNGCGWRGQDAVLGPYSPLCPSCMVGVPVPTRRRVFCASLADVFDNEVPAQWRADLFELIEATPNLDWLLLTKRIGNVPEMMPLWWLAGAKPQPNVWLGATVCNQAEADRDIPKLLRVPAVVRFLSIEPMLGAIDLRLMRAASLWAGDGAGAACRASDRLGLHQVIVGGESGFNARAINRDEVRDLRDQCAAAGVPFLFKQWGEWVPSDHLDAGSLADCQSRRLTCGDMVRVGKKTAGRLLDGVTHDGYPEVRLAHP